MNEQIPAPRDYKKIVKIVAIVLMALVVLVAGALVLKKFWPDLKTGMAEIKKSEKASEVIGEGELLTQRYDFPEFNYQKSVFKASLPDYKIALPELANLKNFEEASKNKFSDAQTTALASNNFFTALNSKEFYGKDPQEAASRADDWTELYDGIGGSAMPENRAPQNSVFVTSDYLLHVYHRLLEKEMEYIEQKNFYVSLKKITDTMLASSIENYNKSLNSGDRQSYERVIAYLAVPSAILNSSYGYSQKEGFPADDNSDSKEAILANLDAMQGKIPAVSLSRAKEEMALVMDAKTQGLSPILGPEQIKAFPGYKEDYTQFNPRSHYRKNPVLRSYFRSMMWYGRQNFLAKSSELTGDAVRITSLMQKNNLMKDWENIYVATAFLVGQSDDLGLYEYGKAMGNAEVSASLIAKVQEEIKTMPGPQIMSSVVVGSKVLGSTKAELQAGTKGFRFMGQRFTPDAFVFSTLTQGQETSDPETGESLPSMTTALMPMSVFGNKTAEAPLTEWIVKNAPNSKKVIANRMASLKDIFGKTPVEKWTQNIYWGWIYTLKALNQETLDKTGYPNFMKSAEWNKKNLQAMLGSWTELKHDTLLYAKQSYAEMGGGGIGDEIPPVPKGYVEPNIEFFDRLIPLAKMTKEGLEKRGLLENEFLGRNEDFLNQLEFYRKIAIAELGNQKITDEDFEKLRIMPGNLEQVIKVMPGEINTEDGARSALIADVHTSIPDLAILYEATGIPNDIYVAVKDANGTRLTKGLVYSYYEFANPLDKRLTDQDWREWVYSTDKSKVPATPAWSQSLIK